MQGWLRLSGWIDALNERIGRIATWMVLLSCLISAGNATTRYAFNMSSNAWLEVQWYMFGAVVMLGASYTLFRNEHVRVDVIYGRLAPRRRAWIDLLGCVVFLMPAMILLTWLSWPVFLDSWRLMEMSNNAGGLLRWPAKLLLPVGFFLLGLQGVSEIIKRIGYLRGLHHMDTTYERPLQ
jgi:TRAP-type mannitol/chloroaromatic compound transport system permease small subunit